MTRIRTFLPLALAVACAGASMPTLAFQSPQPGPRPVPMENARDFRELERLALVEVPYIKKMEIRDALLKVDGYDAQGLKVKVYMDRRNGNVLSREVKYDKHGPFGRHGWAQYPQSAYPAPPVGGRVQGVAPARSP